MMYKILFSQSAQKYYRKLDTHRREQINMAISKLSLGLFRDLDIKKLIGFSDNTYRLRVGPYRLIYDIYEKELMIDVIKIGSR